MDNPTVEADVLTSEEDFLQAAKAYSFVTRMDKGRYTGPVFVSGEGSIIQDLDGKVNRPRSHRDSFP